MPPAGLAARLEAQKRLRRSAPQLVKPASGGNDRPTLPRLYVMDRTRWSARACTPRLPGARFTRSAGTWSGRSFEQTGPRRCAELKPVQTKPSLLGTRLPR